MKFPYFRIYLLKPHAKRLVKGECRESSSFSPTALLVFYPPLPRLSKSRSKTLASHTQPLKNQKENTTKEIQKIIIWSSIFYIDNVFVDTNASIIMYLLVLLLSIYLLYLTLYFGQPLVNFIVITMARHFELHLWRGGRCAVITEPACRTETGEQLVSWRAVSFDL